MATNRLVVSAAVWTDLREHLLRDSEEHLAFLLVGRANLNRGRTFLAHSLIRVDDSDLSSADSHEFGLSLSTDRLLEIMNSAKRSGLILMEAHSHPLSTRNVRFSEVDVRGQRELHEYLLDVHGPAPYGSLVFGRQSVDAVVWDGGQAQPLEEIVVIGDAITGISTTKPKDNSTSGTNGSADRHDRQALAFGKSGQARIRETRVAVVGVGGTGSVVAEQLAHLGVSSLTLVDPDVVETTNLNRLLGATSESVGRLKVDVVGDHVSRIDSTIGLTRYPLSVRTSEVLAAVKECDVMFGCVDSDSGRLIMNELALAYSIPYIDLGVGIETHEGRIVDAGGRVIVWLPGRPCLLCAGEIDVRIAAEELETEEQKRFRREHGYVAGLHVPGPSVISLNGIISSLGVTTFVGLVTGVTSAPFYTYYDLLEHRMGPRIVTRDDRCVACHIAMIGDRARLERYSPHGMPA
jgi:Dinucleotide-utilizing enzymes involved in molybdopterin and thiamine biosynthesis family 2